jgi:hypothetical protein
MNRLFHGLLLVACASIACSPRDEEPVPDHMPARTMVERLAPMPMEALRPMAEDLETHRQGLHQTFYSPYGMSVPVNVLFYQSYYGRHWVLWQRKSDNECSFAQVSTGPLTGSVSIHASDGDDYLESVVSGYTGWVSSCSNTGPILVMSPLQRDGSGNTWTVSLIGDAGGDYITCGGERTICIGYTGNDLINVYHAGSTGYGDQGSDQLTAWSDGVELFGDWEGHMPYGGDCIQTNNFSLWGYNCGPGVDEVQGGVAEIGNCETVVPSCY